MQQGGLGCRWIINKAGHMNLSSFKARSQSWWMNYNLLDGLQLTENFMQGHDWFQNFDLGLRGLKAIWLPFLIRSKLNEMYWCWKKSSSIKESVQRANSPPIQYRSPVHLWPANSEQQEVLSSIHWYWIPAWIPERPFGTCWWRITVTTSQISDNNNNAYLKAVGNRNFPAPPRVEYFRPRFESAADTLGALEIIFLWYSSNWFAIQFAYVLDLDVSADSRLNYQERAWVIGYKANGRTHIFIFDKSQKMQEPR